MYKLIISIERAVFFRTGILLPTLREKWHVDSIKIQHELDNIHHINNIL